ncbi:MAG: PT domain-containing protein [Microgenomates group bacterium]
MNNVRKLNYLIGTLLLILAIAGVAAARSMASETPEVAVEPTAVPTAEPTAVATTEPTAVPTAEPTADPALNARPVITTTVPVSHTLLFVPVGTEDVNDWTVEWYIGATQQMHGEGDLPWADFPTLNPPVWPEFPNVTNDIADFAAEWGLEFGEDESQFCGSVGDLCALVVAPQSYALLSGFWSLDGLGTCNNPEELGCATMIINVGLESAEFSGTLDNVYVISGRYWHGDHLPEAIVAGLSHMTWNMVDGKSVLNPSAELANAGGNCSSVDGCPGVDVQFYVTSGSEPLVHGQTVYRPTQ